MKNIKNKGHEGLEKAIKNILANPKNVAAKQAISSAVKRDPVNVMASIVRMSASLYKKEIENFLVAREAAKNVTQPNRALLVELYNDIAIDPFIYGMMQKRILKISNKSIKVTDGNGKKDDEKSKLLQKKWFNNLLKYAIESKFYGYSLVYFDEISNGRIINTRLVYREHVLPEKKQILVNPYDLSGLDFTKPPYNNYCIGVGDEEDLGLFEKAAVMYILKKHSWGNWDEFEEIFGIPIRTVKTASQDPKVKREMESWLQAMGSAAYGIFPVDAELDIKENNKTDAYEVFFQKIQAANAEIEILFTGQNRVTQKGGSYAKEKAMENETEELTEDDKQFIFYLLNDSLKPILFNLGYPISLDDMLEWDDEKYLSKKERMELFTATKNLGFKVNPEQITKEFDIEIIGDDEEDEQEDGPESKPKTPARKKRPVTATTKSLVRMHKAIEKHYAGHNH